MSSSRDAADIKNSILAGVISGSITAATLQPLEFIKTRLQQPNREKNQTMKSIIRATLLNSSSSVQSHQQQAPKYRLLNVTKFWSGLTPSLIRSAPVAAIYYALIESFKHSNILSHSRKGGNYQILHSIIIGASARSIADVLVFPLALIKTRFESDSYSYKGTLNAFATIFKSEGFTGLYKGMTATLVRDMTYSGVYFAIYSKIKHIAADKLGNNKRNEFNNTTTLYFASCAFVSSVAACTLTQPPDVIRSFMQLDPSKHNRFLSTMRFIYATHGASAFFRGLLPRLARRTLISVMGWTIYERMTIKI